MKCWNSTNMSLFYNLGFVWLNSGNSTLIIPYKLKGEIRTYAGSERV